MDASVPLLPPPPGGFPPAAASLAVPPHSFAPSVTMAPMSAPAPAPAPAPAVTVPQPEPGPSAALPFFAPPAVAAPVAATVTKAVLSGAALSTTAAAAARAYESDTVSVTLEAARAPGEADTVAYTATIANKLSVPITDLVLQLAVPKVRTHMRMTMGRCCGGPDWAPSLPVHAHPAAAAVGYDGGARQHGRPAHHTALSLGEPDAGTLARAEQPMHVGADKGGVGRRRRCASSSSWHVTRRDVMSRSRASWPMCLCHRLHQTPPLHAHRHVTDMHIRLSIFRGRGNGTAAGAVVALCRIRRV
jgi:hypothetical protein